MIRLDLSYFYRLRDAFNALRQVPDEGMYTDVWWDAFTAQSILKELYVQGVVSSVFHSSRAHANKLHERLDKYVQGDLTEKWSQFDKAGLINLLDAFEMVMTSELAVADAYIVTDKSPFSTLSLINQGGVLFPPDLGSKVPSAVPDLENAGRCLAFELPTACGFHVMRAMEAVVRRYWEVATNNKPHPRQRNLGVYLRAMSDAGCGDKKIIAALTQIKDLHRNPISHPEEMLSMEEAIALIGVARSAVSSMLARIPDLDFQLTPPEGPVAQISDDRA